MMIVHLWLYLDASCLSTKKIRKPKFSLWSTKNIRKRNCYYYSRTSMHAMLQGIQFGHNFASLAYTDLCAASASGPKLQLTASRRLLTVCVCLVMYSYQWNLTWNSSTNFKVSCCFELTQWHIACTFGNHQIGRHLVFLFPSFLFFFFLLWWFQ